MTSIKHQMAKRLYCTKDNPWVEFSQLAAKYKAVNLGQGFPDFFPPEYITEALKAAVSTTTNPFMHQYTRSYGNLRLVKIMSELFSPLFGRQIDEREEILITVGATESLFCVHQGLINPGDEVIIIEPFYEAYETLVREVGGIPVAIPLKPTKSGAQISSADWKLDPEELASKFNTKTKAIIVNNPNNPLGKIFTLSELQMIADLCIKHDVLVISDEVYEWMVFKPNQHIRIATLPGMWERTVTIGSAGKTFSVTGWRIGWSIGPKHLLQAICHVHENSTYTCDTPIQEAIAIGFETESKRLDSPECYWNKLPLELVPKRDKVAGLLSEIGMIPTIPEAGYLMVADISNINFQADDSNNEPRDYQFSKWMIINKKLATIPTSIFYTNEHKHLAKNLVRFCYIKEDKTLDSAAEILREWKKSL